MATAKKKAVVEEPKVPERKITYRITRLVHDGTQYNKILAAMEIPATWKITFGPPVMKQADARYPMNDTSRGSLLRVYDGKLQRGVITNVLEFFAQDEINYSEITLK